VIWGMTERILAQLLALVDWVLRVAATRDSDFARWVRCGGFQICCAVGRCGCPLRHAPASGHPARLHAASPSARCACASRAPSRSLATRARRLRRHPHLPPRLAICRRASQSRARISNHGVAVPCKELSRAARSAPEGARTCRPLRARLGGARLGRPAPESFVLELVRDRRLRRPWVAV